MKKKLIKLWGIGMVVVLMASLLIVGATPASAGTLAWTATGLPGGFNQIAATDASIVKIAPNGDIFVVDTQPVAPACSRIYKSTDGGTTWVTGYVALPAVVEQFPVAGTVITDLVISPSYETDSTVFVVGNAGAGTTQVYRSINGGLNFLAFGTVLGGAGEIGTCIDIDPNYNNAVGGNIMVGTANGAAGGDVYVWTTGGFAWIAQGLGEDVYAVAFSPSYGLDATLLAVSASGAGTVLHHEKGLAPFGAWDPTSVGTPPLDLPATTVTGATHLEIISADIAIPNGYNASVPATRSMYVAVNSGGLALSTDDSVYRCFSSGAVGVATALCPAFVYTATPNIPVRSIDFDGTNTSGTLAVGIAGSSAVWVTNNPGSPSPSVVFITAINPPTPAAANNAYVALSNTYSADTTVYVGTSGGALNDESAVSVSTDGGANWAQKGLIDTVSITAGANIGDFVPYNATEWYLVTENAGAPLESLWKTVDGGLTWVRVSTLNTATGFAEVRLSENYAADSTLYFMEWGTGAVSAPLLNYSGNAGASWEGRATPTGLTGAGVGIIDMVVVDQFTLYIADGGTNTIYRSINAGWLWNTQTLALGGALNEIVYNDATGHILAGDQAGNVFLNSTGLTWDLIAAVPGAGGAVVVAFDGTYDGTSNNNVWAGDTTGAAGGLYRFAGVPQPPLVAIPTVASAIQCSGIVVAPDNTLYAADFAAGGGVLRVLSDLVTVETLAAADGLTPAGASLWTIEYTPGSNVIYSIEISGVHKVVTYTDTLTTAVPAVLSPAEGDVVLAANAAVTIEPIAGIPFPGGTYTVQWNTRPDWLGTGAVIGIPAVINSVNLNVVGTPASFGPDLTWGTPDDIPAVPAATVPAGSTIYFRVRVVAPANGPWSPTMTFETQLTQGTVNAPAILSPSENGTGPGGWDAELNPTFSWGVIAGATNYEFQLATDAGMIDLIVDATGVDALGNVLVYTLTDITLDYNTTYYWRVRAISATSETEWSAVVGFTTMAEPPPPSEPPTFTQPPEVTFTVELPEQPTPTTVEVVQEEVSQGYIWAIIIIGAVLVIAVIVLIVRTRRSV